MIRPVRRGTQELVPADMVRDAGCFLEPAQTLRPDRPIGPYVNLLDGPQRPERMTSTPERKPPSDVPWLPIWVQSFFSAASVRIEPRFLDRPGQRLLAKAVLAHAHGHDAGRGMRMVRSAHGDGVNLVVEFVEHLPVVIIFLGLGVLGPHLIEGMGINVAKPDDLAMATRVVGVAVSLAADADAGKANLFVGRTRRCTCKGRCSGTKTLPATPASAVCVKKSRRFIFLALLEKQVGNPSAHPVPDSRVRLPRGIGLAFRGERPQSRSA